MPNTTPDPARLAEHKRDLERIDLVLSDWRTEVADADTMDRWTLIGAPDSYRTRALNRADHSREQALRNLRRIVAEIESAIARDADRDSEVSTGKEVDR